MSVHAFVFLLMVCLLLSLALLWRLCWYPLRPSSSKGEAIHSRAHRLLKPRRPHDCPACRLASTPALGAGPAATPVRPLVRDQKPAGSTEANTHRGLGLSQPAVHVLRDHRCPRSCLGWRWQAWPCRTDPDLSLPGVPYHVHCPAQHGPVPFENPFAPDRSGTLRAGRGAGSFGGLAGLRLSTSYDHYLADSRWGTCTDLTRTFLLPSAAPTPPTGRTAHPAALRQTGAVALAGRRPLYEASSHAPSGSPYTKRCAYSHPLPATYPGPWLSPALHQ